MEYVVRIGEIYFGIVEKKARPQGGFMDIIGSLMGGKPNLSSDSEDEESEGAIINIFLTPQQESASGEL